MTETQTKTSTEKPPLAQPAPASTGITIHRARLPYVAGVDERFGVDRSTWRALVESIFPLAKTPEAIVLALAYCRDRGLDIMKKPVHIVPMWNAELSKEVETVWPSITEHRITAARSNAYAGADPTAFGERKTKTFKGKLKAKGNKPAKELEVTVTFPEWAQVTVYRFVQGQRVAFPGPRVYWEEFYGTSFGSKVPNARWERAPSQMLEKCAEAAALRKAFPEEVGTDYVAEEVDGKTIDRREDVRPPAKPARTAGGELAETDTPQDGFVVVEDADEDDDGVIEGEATEVVDPKTGEVTEAQGSPGTGAAAPATETAAKTAAPSPAPGNARQPAPKPAGDPRDEPPPIGEEVPRGKETSALATAAIEDEDEDSPELRAGKEMVERCVGSLDEFTTAEELDDFRDRVRTNCDSLPGLSTAERELIWGMFNHAFLERKVAIERAAKANRKR